MDFLRRSSAAATSSATKADRTPESSCSMPPMRLRAQTTSSASVAPDKVFGDLVICNLVSGRALARPINHVEISINLKGF